MIERETASNCQHRHFAFLAWVALTEVLLIGVTGPLWWPPLNLGAPDLSDEWPFPQIPLVSMVASVPPIWDRITVCVWLLAISLQGIAASWLFLASWQRKDKTKAYPQKVFHRLLTGAIGMGLFAWPVLIILNQHRFQAWAYLAWWIGILWLLGFKRGQSASPQNADVSTRWKWLAISVYFYSAVSKFDLTFLQSLGNQFATALWNIISGNALPLDTVWPLGIVLLFPLGELVLAFGLASGFWPKKFCLLAIIMHGLLLLILGPWGLQHQPGVLVWNLFFIGQACLLFWPRPTTRMNGLANWSCRWPTSTADWALYVVLLWPLTQPWGWCDHWPAWELYAPRGSRVQVFLAQPAWESNEELAKYLAVEPSKQHGPLWRELRLDQWSLEQLKAPIYPQDRFQLGVAEYVLEGVPDGSQVLVQWYGPANRWSGTREQRILRGSRELRDFGRRFYWNSHPRTVPNRNDLEESL